ncbi:MAG: DNA-binding protein WhiA [Chloroflexi bacterium]|nr:MAG: DNA-binding protein WhiA [Chloroflexota bacterium]
MLVASEVKGELARIVPARLCCRRAELAGLLSTDRTIGAVSTFDYGTARIAVQLAASLGLPISGPHPASRSGRPLRDRSPRRHHLVVGLDQAAIGEWAWDSAPACDRRAYLRGVLLGRGSISLGNSGPHVEFVLRGRRSADALRRRLRESGARAGLLQRRGRWVIYLKGREEVATLLRLTGANRGLLDFETARVGSEVRNRLNRLLNAEEANLARTVRAADRQLRAIDALEAGGRLQQLPDGLRAAATERKLQPEADLDTLAGALGVSRSAANHRLRRIVELAQGGGPRAASSRRARRRVGA